MIVEVIKLASPGFAPGLATDCATGPGEFGLLSHSARSRCDTQLEDKCDKMILLMRFLCLSQEAVARLIRGCTSPHSLQSPRLRGDCTSPHSLQSPRLRGDRTSPHSLQSPRLRGDCTSPHSLQSPRLRGDRTSPHSLQSLLCLHTQSKDVDEGSQCF